MSFAKGAWHAEIRVKSRAINMREMSRESDFNPRVIQEMTGRNILRFYFRWELQSMHMSVKESQPESS